MARTLQHDLITQPTTRRVIQWTFVSLPPSSFGPRFEREKQQNPFLGPGIASEPKSTTNMTCLRRASRNLGSKGEARVLPETPLSALTDHVRPT